MTIPGRAVADPDLLPEEPQTPAPDSVEEVADQVRLDAQDDPEMYLKETIVPGGGE